MQVFRLYFKLMKKNIGNIMVYMGIFLGILVLSTVNQRDHAVDVFNDTKADIAFINQDEDSELVKGFENYISKSCNIIDDIGESKEELQDALFFRRVEYIITVPKGFTKDFLEGKNPSLVKLTVPDSTNGAYVDLMIDSYFNAARVYRKTFPEISGKELNANIKKNLENTVKVTIQAEDGHKDNSLKVAFFNFYAYGIISVLTIGISIVMVSLRELDLRRRNIVAPITNMSFNLQQILANVIFAVVVTVFLIVVGLATLNELSFDSTTLLFIFNAFVFSSCALSMSYLIGITVKSSATVNAISNVVALGLSFVSGVFVPKELLGNTALTIGKFTPTYWYVTATEEIGKLSHISFDSASNVIKYMLIEVAFSLALISIALVISKKNNTQEC